MDGRVVRELRQGQGPSVLPPDLPWVHRQPHQAEHRENPVGEAHLSGVTKALQEAADQRPGGPAGEQGPAKGPQPQDGAEHPPDPRLGDETGAGAEAGRFRSHRGLRPAQAGTQGDEDPAGGTADLVPTGSKRERRVRAVLCGAGHRPAAWRAAGAQVGGH